MEKLTYPWWIMGPTKEVLRLLPTRLDGYGLGCVYDLELKSGRHKIGSTRTPDIRIREQIRTFSNYAQDPVRAIGLAMPTTDYVAIEKSVHANLDRRKLNGGVFRASRKAVWDAMLMAFARVSMKPGKPSSTDTTRRSGRKPRPWYRTSRRRWFVSLKGRQYDLGADPGDAFIAFAGLMAAHGLSTDVTEADLVHCTGNELGTR
jgi:hypothetical protein